MPGGVLLSSSMQLGVLKSGFSLLREIIGSSSESQIATDWNFEQIFG